MIDALGVHGADERALPVLAVAALYGVVALGRRLAVPAALVAFVLALAAILTGGIP